MPSGSAVNFPGMALYRFTVNAAVTTLLPKDHFVNDLYYTRILDSGDDEGLCLDLANIFSDFWYQPGEIRVNMYDQPTSGPSGPPRATAVVDAGSPIACDIPREVAICLSFWASERANPHRRGRIFLGVGPSAFGPAGLRPSSTIRNAVLGLGDELAGLGGADVSWQVFSRSLGDSEDVTNTWVDDEWDTIRSRGLERTLQDTRGV